MDKLDGIIAQWQRERPDLDVSAMALLGRLSRLQKLLSREMQKTFAEHGLNGPAFDVLATLRRSGAPHALTAGELLNAMMVTSGTMTNRIDQLVKAGWVERRKNPDDGRGVLIGLTDSGFTKIDQVIADHVHTQTRLVGLLGEDEAGSLDALLKTYLARAEDRLGDS